MHQENQNQDEHLPVLLEQVLTVLDPQEGASYLDLTAGYGGHAAAILERTKSPNRAVLIDRDPAAVKRLKERFTARGTRIIQSDFLSASQQLAQANEQFDLILADLGVSSPHLNQASRGFSIQHDGPLDMRMDTETQSLTAEMVVNTFSEEEIARLLKTYGEEPKARTIARLITSNRPLHTTKELANLVAKAWPGHSRVHPATRTFQAIRVAVNDELEQLRHALPIWIEKLLAPGGRLGVISFHSLEDRLVKQVFGEYGGDRYDAVLRLLTRHPVTGSDQELVINPRARSAKLRAAAKQT